MPPAPPLRLDIPGFAGLVRTDLDARAVYAEGAGIAQCVPAAVVVPRDAADVGPLVAWAARTRTALVPRGSGSGMAGGAVGAGVIVDLSRLDAIGEVVADGNGLGDADASASGRARCAVPSTPRRARPDSRFPPDPSSGAFCTVGGMASTNAAGARALRHGATRRWVSALDCVFADGTRAVVRRGAPPPDVPAVRRFLADVAPTLARPAPCRSTTCAKSRRDTRSPTTRRAASWSTCSSDPRERSRCSWDSSWR